GTARARRLHPRPARRRTGVPERDRDGADARRHPLAARPRRAARAPRHRRAERAGAVAVQAARLSPDDDRDDTGAFGRRGNGMKTMMLVCALFAATVM